MGQPEELRRAHADRRRKITSRHRDLPGIEQGPVDEAPEAEKPAERWDGSWRAVRDSAADLLNARQAEITVADNPFQPILFQESTGRKHRHHEAVTLFDDDDFGH